MKANISIITTLLVAAASTTQAQTAAYDFKDWVAAHLVYPQSAYERMAEASIPIGFRVAADGTIFDVRCRADLSREDAMTLEMVDAAIETVSSAPAWESEGGDGEPGEHSLTVEFEMPEFITEPAHASDFPNSDGDSGEGYRESRERLREWIASQVAVPEDFRMAFTGVIEKGGTLGHRKVVSTSDEILAAEVLAALENAPEWTPALNRDGKPVRAFRYISLNFGDFPDDSGSGDDGMVMPAFRGGDLNKFRDWVSTRLIYPRHQLTRGIQGTVLLSFFVDKQGDVSDIKVLHSPNEALTNEVLRVTGNSPKWEPGHDALGMPRNFYYVMPVVFRL